ncbi:DUF5672 family protein, partial [Rodentibacter caecimuris]
ALPDYIEHIEVKPFSYFEYNFFMLYSLGRLIKTDFALIVQNDGWVMNGQNWRDEFFDYDYIGASVPTFVEVQHNQYICHHSRKHWLQHYPDVPENMYESQNGGFSLRSRRLLNASRELGLAMSVMPPLAIDQYPVSLQWQPTAPHIEDTFLTTIKRRFLEEQGFRFAPREIATRFSVETLMVHIICGTPLEEVMGVHFGSDMVLIGEKDILLKRKLADSIEELKRNVIITELLRTGHNLHIPAEFNLTEKAQ